jgi:hypothetical protein
VKIPTIAVGYAKAIAMQRGSMLPAMGKVFILLGTAGGGSYVDPPI